MEHFYEVETANVGDEVYLIDDDGRVKCTYICDLRKLSIETDYPHVIYDEWYGVLQDRKIYKMERK